MSHWWIMKIHIYNNTFEVHVYMLNTIFSLQWEIWFDIIEWLLTFTYEVQMNMKSKWNLVDSTLLISYLMITKTNRSTQYVPHVVYHMKNIIWECLTICPFISKIIQKTYLSKVKINKESLVWVKPKWSEKWCSICVESWAKCYMF